MSTTYENRLIPLAKELRKDMTPEERHLWYDFLADYPIRFQRQKAIASYIVDFYCHKARLVIELDGRQHNEEEAIVYDEARTAVLQQHGLEVVRFANSEITQEFDAVCEMLHRMVEKRVGRRIVFRKE